MTWMQDLYLEGSPRKQRWVKRESETGKEEKPVKRHIIEVASVSNMIHLFSSIGMSQNSMEYQDSPRIIHLKNGGAEAFIHQLPIPHGLRVCSRKRQLPSIWNKFLCVSYKALGRMTSSHVSLRGDPGLTRWVCTLKKLSITAATEVSTGCEDVTPWAWAQGICYSLSELRSSEMSSFRQKTGSFGHCGLSQTVSWQVNQRTT